MEGLGLGEVVQRRLHNAGAAPGITSREILSRGPACPTKWRDPVREPTEEERRFMLGIMLEHAIIQCMEHHFYQQGGLVRKQKGGAAIGLRLSEALGRSFGLVWDRKLVEKMEKLDWKPDMVERYVDDLNGIMDGVKPGTRYDKVEDKLGIVEDKIEEDEGKEDDEITMMVFKEVADAIDEDIAVEVDFPSNYEDKKMPILDMKMAMNEDNKVVYKFYRKPQSNNTVMMARSAVSDKVKRSTMTNEAMRRLMCCSPNLEDKERVEVMEDFARLMKRSGYKERFRHEVISDALKGHAKRVKEEEEGRRPLNRPRRYEEEKRRRAKEDKKERWYRKEARGSRVREGVLILPPTPHSILAMELQRICKEELEGCNISITTMERGGTRLGQVLGTTLPGASQREHCGRVRCFPCNSGQVGVCRRTGIGYEITCTICANNTIVAKYGGESGRNLFKRGEEYVQDWNRKAADKPLWKHVLEKHEGRAEVELFKHFQMVRLQVFQKPQRRKANEGVRIANLDPETRMNSKDEFRQGTNIFLQPVRGVGET